LRLSSNIVKSISCTLKQQAKTPLNTGHIAVLNAFYGLVEGIGMTETVGKDKISSSKANAHPPAFIPVVMTMLSC
jgi:hypothetical protein